MTSNDATLIFPQSPICTSCIRHPLGYIAPALGLTWEPAPSVAQAWTASRPSLPGLDRRCSSTCTELEAPLDRSDVEPACTGHQQGTRRNRCLTENATYHNTKDSQWTPTTTPRTHSERGGTAAWQRTQPTTTPRNHSEHLPQHQESQGTRRNRCLTENATYHHTEDSQWTRKNRRLTENATYHNTKESQWTRRNRRLTENATYHNTKYSEWMRRNRRLTENTTYHNTKESQWTRRNHCLTENATYHNTEDSQWTRRNCRLTENTTYHNTKYSEWMRRNRRLTENTTYHNTNYHNTQLPQHQELTEYTHKWCFKHQRFVANVKKLLVTQYHHHNTLQDKTRNLTSHNVTVYNSYWLSSNSSSPVYTIQPAVKLVVKPIWQPTVSCIQTFNRLSNPFDNRLNVRIHDTAGCQTGCTTRIDNRLNEQRLFVQHGCETRLATGLIFGNWFDNRLYHVYEHSTGCQTGLTTGWMVVNTI